MPRTVLQPVKKTVQRRAKASVSKAGFFVVFIVVVGLRGTLNLHLGPLLPFRVRMINARGSGYRRGLVSELRDRTAGLHVHGRNHTVPIPKGLARTPPGASW